MEHEFNQCPRCGSTNIDETDYERDEENEFGDDHSEADVSCNECGWEGDIAELVNGT